MLKELIISDNFISDLFLQIEHEHNIPRDDIECILLCGSALYFENPHDIDFKVILKNTNNVSQKTLSKLNVQNYTVDCLYYTPASWKSVTKTHYPCQFITESPDLLCIYGSDKKFYRFDILKSKSLKKYIATIWDKYFFNIRNAKTDNLFTDKRLWNFLLFAYKILNNSHILTEQQKIQLQKAHDGELIKETFIPTYNEVVSKIYS